jgi:LmbE family N-acetylglucosaminyl deacetylase
MKRSTWIFLLYPFFAFSQPAQQPDASQIKLKLKKLNFLGSVLYVAAHPDDENTRIITYLSNDRLAATAYLSLTRGDGGQNLIGPEIGDLLGLIRTQELLAARRIDGGQQFFTRAIDFGFSKSADEAFEVWGKENVLSDVIKIFRQYQPDVIITRFPPDERAGHGHHTASAVLAGEAFDAAANPAIFPEQVKETGTWQVKRLYTNTGRWWNREINEKSPGVITFDVGGYNALLGKSYTEISALSSSQHKSQGWGRRGERGYQPEFLEFMKGEKAEKDIFEGVTTTWSRIKGGEKVQTLVDKVIREYNEENPAAIVPQLLQIRKEITALPEGVWKTRKLAETEELIQDCLGLFIEITASHYQGSPGEKIKTSIEVVNRSGVDIRLQDIRSSLLQWDTIYAAPLIGNTVVTVKSQPEIDPSAKYSGPYWLQQPHEVGLFNIEKSEFIGLPENPAAIRFTFNFTVGDEALSIVKPMMYKWVDPVKGELWRPFEIVPPVFVNPLEKIVIFNNTQPKQLSFLIKSSSDKPVQGGLSLRIPKGWRTEPASINFKLASREEEQTSSFLVYPAEGESTEILTGVATVNGKAYNQALLIVGYDHIPTQTLLPKSQVSAVKMELKKAGSVIGYIRGAGDEVPSVLRNMGYDVWEMKDDEVTALNLKKVDAVVMGVRALNTNKRIRYFMDDLLAYVHEGGTLVMQYNVNFNSGIDKFSPYPLKISRDRVTSEDSEVRMLKPGHDVLNTPNKITARDFEGWIQERGLYFPNEWDPNFEAILSMNDKGETPKDGGLLVAKYGQGYYVYTGLSFFRELPAGVAGAYKLFANIVSLGNTEKNENAKAKSKNNKLK